MFYLIAKFFISALLIVAISEFGKRNSLLAATLASIPLVSVLAMIWLYADTKNTQKIAMLSQDIFWLVIPSLILFVALPIFLKKGLHFYFALSLSLGLMVAGYFVMVALLKSH